MNDNLIYYLALSSNKYIGPRRYKKIIDELGSIKSFFELKTNEQIELLNIKNDNCNKYFENMLKNGEKIQKVCNKKGIKIITIDDYNYPEKLKNLNDPPFILFYYGELNLNFKMVAIVGTRKPSNDAIEVNKYFTRELTKYPIGIISGMAKGHDSIAHKTALENNAYTIAILGNSVDIIYPKENKEIYHIIKEMGCILSEYPPTRTPDKFNFPIRNRLISGLSDAVLIVQAPEKSGALITAKYAEIQSKDLYAIPGNPSNPKNFGTNKLIQNGAKIALTPEDIIKDLFQEKSNKTSNLKINIELENLTEEEKNILNFLDQERNIEELINLTGISLNKLIYFLTDLELKGYVQQYTGNIYSKVIK